MFSRDVDTTLEGLENITFIPTGKPISPDDDPEEEIYHGPDEFFCGEPRMYAFGNAWEGSIARIGRRPCDDVNSASTPVGP